MGSSNVRREARKRQFASREELVTKAINDGSAAPQADNLRLDVASRHVPSIKEDHSKQQRFIVFIGTACCPGKRALDLIQLRLQFSR